MIKKSFFQAKGAMDRQQTEGFPTTKDLRRLTIIWGITLFLLFSPPFPDAHATAPETDAKYLYLAQAEEMYLPVGVNQNCTTEQLIWAVEHADSEHQRRYAATLLADREAKEALPSLLRALKDSEEIAQIGAANALGAIGDVTILEELLANFSHENSRVRQYSAYVVGRLANRMNEAVKTNQEVVDGLEGIAGDEEMTVRVEVIYALYEVGSPLSTEIFMEALRDEEPRVRSYAATALGDLKTQYATEALINALEVESDRDVRRKMASALGGIGGDFALNTLVRMLPKEAALVRADIATKLAEVKSPQSVEILTNLLLEDPDGRVRTAAAVGLLKAKERSAIQALAEALKDRVKSVRRPASEALVSFADESVIDQLIEALGNSDTRVADNAAKALVRLSNLDAVHGLIKSLDSPNQLEVTRALDVLQEITHRPYRSDAEKWKVWYEENFVTEG